MSSQSHGNTFEHLFKAAFKGASNHARSPIADFDIEAKFDAEKGIPTSIKTTCQKTVCLADATRFFSLKSNFRMLVLKYKQVDGYKVPETLYEFIITAEEHNRLCGDMPIETVRKFHNELKNFSIGCHKEARKWADEFKKNIDKQYNSKIVLNRKIDSKTQRRLQASISLKNLLEEISDVKIYNSLESTIDYRGITIGKIRSEKRTFNDK